MSMTEQYFFLKVYFWKDPPLKGFFFEKQVKGGVT